MGDARVLARARTFLIRSTKIMPWQVSFLFGNVIPRGDVVVWFFDNSFDI
jgi:hypothetical protein